jgi:hypothetical protein
MNKYLAAEPGTVPTPDQPRAGGASRPTGPEPGSAPGLLRSTRVILIAFVILTAVATNQLFVLSSRTAGGFAWTIQPPVTAAFLGAGYGAGCILVLLSLRARTWAQARLTVTTVLIFVTLTLIATITHTGKFHFAAAGIVPRFAAWFWLGIYITVPLALIAAIAAQLRRREPEPARGRPLPRWLAIALGAQGTVMLAGGITLLADPRSAATLWPWPLTPLTTQAIAAWLIAFGAAAALALRERDLGRLRPAAAGYVVLGVLQLLAVARFAGELRWSSAAAFIYVALLVSITVTGGAGWRLARSGESRRQLPVAA